MRARKIKLTSITIQWGFFSSTHYFEQKGIQYISYENQSEKNEVSVQFAFAEETDALHQEMPEYPIASFVADTGGAAGLIFGLNIMGGLKFKEKSLIMIALEWSFKNNSPIDFQLLSNFTILLWHLRPFLEEIFKTLFRWHDRALEKIDQLFQRRLNTWKLGFHLNHCYCLPSLMKLSFAPKY